MIHWETNRYRNRGKAYWEIGGPKHQISMYVPFLHGSERLWRLGVWVLEPLYLGDVSTAIPGS
jgi:hypothetical protein